MRCQLQLLDQELERGGRYHKDLLPPEVWRSAPRSPTSKANPSTSTCQITQPWSCLTGAKPFLLIFGMEEQTISVVYTNLQVFLDTVEEQQREVQTKAGKLGFGMNIMNDANDNDEVTKLFKQGLTNLASAVQTNRQQHQ